MDGTRDAKGHFVAGKWQGGPGRKPKPGTDYRNIVETCLTPDAFYRIVERATKDAINGDARARAWLTQYVLTPLPKILKVEDSTTADRSRMDVAISQLPAEEFAALESIISKVEGSAANG